MIQRLLELMRIKTLTSSQLADAIGVQRSGISHFVSGRNKPSLEFILKILTHFPDINPDWLLFGKEPVYRNGEIILPERETGHESESKNPETPGDLPVLQSSLLDDLFNAPLYPHINKTEETIQDLKPDMAEEPPTTTERVKGQGGKEKTGIERSTPDTFNNESAEKIVLLFKNKTFREYFPE